MFKKMIFGTFGAPIGPYILLQMPYEWLIQHWEFHNVCTNEKFDSMYGWYGSNAKKMWKIANFGLFLMIFGTFGAPKGPYILP